MIEESKKPRKLPPRLVVTLDPDVREWLDARSPKRIGRGGRRARLINQAVRLLMEAEKTLEQFPLDDPE